MTEWSKALPLTASCLSPLPALEYRPGHVRVPSGMGLSDGFAEHLAKYGRKSDNYRNSKFHALHNDKRNATLIAVHTCTIVTFQFL